jgi:hypothetical protein
VALLKTVYADDESIWLLVRGEYESLVSEDAVMAAGDDGSFAEDPWSLVVAADLTDAGLTPGMIVHLDVADPDLRPATWPIGGLTCVVDAEPTGAAIPLRRVGQPSRAGQPIGVEGLTGVAYRVLTFAPQIEDESYQINMQYAIDPLDPVRAPSSITDLRALRRATVLRVIAWAYQAAMQAPDDRWDKKLQNLRKALQGMDDFLSLRFAGESVDTQAFFGMRYSR